MKILLWVIAGIAAAIIVTMGVSLVLIQTPGAPPQAPPGIVTGYSGAVPAGAMLRVPVTGLYPGGVAADLNPDMPNPLASDPEAAQRGMKDFASFNCSGCHGPNGGGGMGPSLSEHVWLYRASPANIYLSIVQGRGAGMPAFGAMLPDRTVWELVAYIQSIALKPTTFGRTTSADPQLPSLEQVPAGTMQTTTPWDFTEPKPKDGQESGTGG